MITAGSNFAQQISSTPFHGFAEINLNYKKAISPRLMLMCVFTRSGRNKLPVIEFAVRA